MNDDQWEAAVRRKLREGSFVGDDGAVALAREYHDRHPWKGVLLYADTLERARTHLRVQGEFRLIADDLKDWIPLAYNRQDPEALEVISRSLLWWAHETSVDVWGQFALEACARGLEFAERRPQNDMTRLRLLLVYAQANTRSHRPVARKFADELLSLARYCLDADERVRIFRSLACLYLWKLHAPYRAFRAYRESRRALHSGTTSLGLI